MENNTTFHAGICMAGAISAGAYTAGVVDIVTIFIERAAYQDIIQVLKFRAAIFFSPLHLPLAVKAHNA